MLFYCKFEQLLNNISILYTFYIIEHLLQLCTIEECSFTKLHRNILKGDRNEIF